MSQDMLDGFDPADVAAAIAARQHDLRVIGASRAMRRQHQTKTRRVNSDEQIALLLPSKIQPDESWHLLSSGDIDVLSLLRHLLAGAGHFDTVLMTTWRINRDDLEQIDAWLDSGLIETYHLIIDQRFQRLAPDEYQLALRLSQQYGGSVSMCMNHSKVTLCGCRATDTWLVIESSANVNTNHRLEQSAIHNCRALHDFYYEAFDGIRCRRNTPAL
jgi:hypothetical protein